MESLCPSVQKGGAFSKIVIELVAVKILFQTKIKSPKVEIGLWTLFLWARCPESVGVWDERRKKAFGKASQHLEKQAVRPPHSANGYVTHMARGGAAVWAEQAMIPTRRGGRGGASRRTQASHGGLRP